MGRARELVFVPKLNERLTARFILRDSLAGELRAALFDPAMFEVLLHLGRDRFFFGFFAKPDATRKQRHEDHQTNEQTTRWN